VQTSIAGKLVRRRRLRSGVYGIRRWPGQRMALSLYHGAVWRRRVYSSLYRLRPCRGRPVDDRRIPHRQKNSTQSCRRLVSQHYEAKSRGLAVSGCKRRHSKPAPFRCAALFLDQPLWLTRRRVIDSDPAHSGSLTAGMAERT
jgi:hypothetical protein